jgi:hypothetical protein
MEPSWPWASVSELTHELRESLSTIMLWEQILRASSDPTVIAQALDAIHEAAHAQDRAIERFAEACERLRIR